MKRISPLLLLAAAVVGITGCSSVYDTALTCETEVRNCILAKKAWHHWSWCYKDLEYPYHFSKGFQDGYEDILSGGNGCQPTLPPQCYWKPQFQTPVGRAQTYAWFDGFSHGALAAKQDGYGGIGEIPISPTAKANIELSKQPRPETMYLPADAPAEGAAPLVLPGAEAIPPAKVIEGDPANGFNPVAPPIPVRPYE